MNPVTPNDAERMSLVRSIRQLERSASRVRVLHARERAKRKALEVALVQETAQAELLELDLRAQLERKAARVGALQDALQALSLERDVLRKALAEVRAVRQ